MSTPTLSIALQEWSAVCHGLLTGQWLLGLRKGGIHERHGGLFVPEHEKFALLPTLLHQDSARLRPGVALGEAPPAGRLLMSGWCRIERVWQVRDLARAQALGEHLPFTADEVARRFAYREPGVFVLLLRAWRLTEPLTIADDPSYAGCRSWITLREPVPMIGTPVLADPAFSERSAAIARMLDP
jgi:hypothetical protein